MIGIIGVGNVGTALGRRLAARGHPVMLTGARSLEKLTAQARSMGSAVRTGTPIETATASEVVILATPWAATLDYVRQISGVMRGKILWDATNPLKADMSGLELGLTSSAGEEVAKAAPEARVVKAVPPFAEMLAGSSMQIDGRRPGVFVCGDDATARERVLALVADLEADGVDAGPLVNARYTEPLGMLLVQLAYVQGFGARIGSSLLREATR